MVYIYEFLANDVCGAEKRHSLSARQIGAILSCIIGLLQHFACLYIYCSHRLEEAAFFVGYNILDTRLFPIDEAVGLVDRKCQHGR